MAGKTRSTFLGITFDGIWAAVLGVIVLGTAVHSAVQYDHTLSKKDDLACAINSVKKTTNIEICQLRAMLLLKISDDLAVTLKKRISTIEDEYQGKQKPTLIDEMLHTLRNELAKVTEDRMFWSNAVRTGNFGKQPGELTL